MKTPRFAACLAVLAASFTVNIAAAREEFPEQMQDEMDLACVPSCLLCHTDEDGGAEDLNRYGLQMQKDGIQLGNGITRVFGADTGTTVKADFDRDGEFDRDEIIANTDPRTEEEVGVCSDAVYGCAAQVAPGGSAMSPWAVVAALGVAALLFRQLRRA